LNQVFPQFQWDDRDKAWFTAPGGLSKRELFAGMAMLGLLNRPDVLEGELIAAAAVEYGDALIAALAKQPEAGE
jgi:hypothetical protein